MTRSGHGGAAGAGDEEELDLEAVTVDDLDLDRVDAESLAGGMGGVPNTHDLRGCV